jgi:CRP-like cAMP-binding protein
VTIPPGEQSALIERLAQQRRLRAVPRPELEWLVTNGELRTFAPGEYIARTGDPRELFHLNVVLAGRVTTYVHRDRVRRKIRETRAGEFVGLLPFSRMTHSTADLVVDEPVELLRIDSARFPTLVRE